jgi:hypothetical protein
MSVIGSAHDTGSEVLGERLRKRMTGKRATHKGILEKLGQICSEGVPSVLKILSNWSISSFPEHWIAQKSPLKTLIHATSLAHDHYYSR